MAFSAGRFARILRGVLLIGLPAAVASCSKTTVAGVLLRFETDGTLDPDTLHVTITANGQTPLDWCYPITNPATFFPTTLAIAPNGDPTETVAVAASVLRAGVTLDVRQNYLTEVPNDRVMEYDILFSGKCSAQVGSVVGPPHGTNCPYGVAASLCPTGETCSSATGMCESNVVPSSTLPDSGTRFPDGGSTESRDATLADGGDGSNDANDASTDIGSEATSIVVPSADASGDASAPDANTDTGVDAAQPPSCAPGGPGMTNCGPGGSATESCCTSLEVTGGTYFRMYTNDGTGPTGEADPATVSSFRLDKYLVTVGRFRQFVSAWNAGYTASAGSGKHSYLNNGNGLNATQGGYEAGWVASDDSNVAPTDANLACGGTETTWTPSPDIKEKLPINCVNWWEAYAFCIWDGGFLPSEAEWEYAAAGGSQQREYPWGSTAPGTSNQYAIYGTISGNCYYPSGKSAPCSGAASIAPVGTATLGAGRWDQLDLAGDIFEWTRDWYAPYVDPCTDCTVLSGEYMALRGGGFSWDMSNLLPPSREVFTLPSNANQSWGFRCARSP
jgi:sulfatase modifying factor 1